MYNKKLIEELLELRKTKMEKLTTEDRTYVIAMDKLFKSIQNLVPLSKIDELTDVFVEYVEHTNDKFYKLGFYDAINLILGGTQNVIR